MVVCLSLVVITGFVGQVSLAQVTLAGVSGFAVSHMFVDAGIGFPWGPLAGSVAGCGGRPDRRRVRAAGARRQPRRGDAGRRRRHRAVRVRQLEVGRRQRRLPGRAADSCSGSTSAPTPSFRGLDGKVPSPVLGFVFLVVVIALCLLVANLRRSVLGQQMLAVRANERAAAAAGINVARVKITAYAISSFIAGTAGWMYAYNFGSVSAARFGFLIALGFVAFAYIGGITMVSGAVDRRAGRHRGPRAPLLPGDARTSPATGRCWSVACS